ncbi:hypothetical protein QCB44_01570 [Thiomicrorhabdus sp. zzn3]|uniref:hypothetical protein n=1 Tax=Thiomicrorhabdus sp. zzn3 TaxID=3039775 RepID=UPI00243646F2|nr:hypothetical protein [Thiomicrorhabdus sp. zzn3]MDG6777387.1 hypothetical protein [Thiomicrorhabdus sp. zzn3]
MKMRKIVLAMFASTAIAGLSGCFSSSSSGSDLDTNTESGSVVDWYLQNAFVFADFNGNSQYDADTDVAAEGLTDENGAFTLNVPASMGTDYVIVSQGGTDTATGATFNGILKATPGATAVTPLTTLVQATGDAAAVRSFLGLAEDADLSADPATDKTLYAASQALVYVISSITSLIDYATTETVDAATAETTYSNLVTAAIADAIAAGSTTFDVAFVTQTITNVATDLGVSSEDADTLANKSTQIVNQTSQIIDDINAVATLDATSAQTVQTDVETSVEAVLETAPSITPVDVSDDSFISNDEVEYLTGTGTDTGAETI